MKLLRQPNNHELSNEHQAINYLKRGVQLLSKDSKTLNDNFLGSKYLKLSASALKTLVRNSESKKIKPLLRSLGKIYLLISDYKDAYNYFNKTGINKSEWKKVAHIILEKGLLAGMTFHPRWNLKLAEQNRDYAIAILKKSHATKEQYVELGNIIINQHAHRKLTESDCDSAIELYKKSNSFNNIYELIAYLKIKKYKFYKKYRTFTKSKFPTSPELINKYSEPPGIRSLVKSNELNFSLADEISTNIQLASALEPLSEKDGCTTRKKDLCETQTLEEFIAAGINIGPVFAQLTKHLLNTNSPREIYKFYYQAIARSKKLREGGRINQGIIEFAIPIIVSQVLYDPLKNKSAAYILSKTREVLSSTSRKDVISLIEAKRLAYLMSRVDRDVNSHDAKTVLEYYEKEVILEKRNNNLKGIVHNKQFTNSFEEILFVYNKIIESKSIKLSKKVEEAYSSLRMKDGYNSLAPGLGADFIAIALYLYFTYASYKEVIN